MTPAPAPQPVPSPVPASTPVPILTGPPNVNIASQCTPSVARGSSNESVRKLTKLELLRTLQDLADNIWEFSSIGLYNAYPYTPYDGQDKLQLAFNNYPDEFARIPGEDFEHLHGAEQVSAWIDASDSFASKFLALNRQANFLSEGCRTSTLSSDCIAEFITKFGRRALRRPVTEIEMTSYKALATADAGSTLHLIISRMLRSPDFLFLIETGTVDDGTRTRLTDHEVASRISYATIGSAPDAELNTEADAGRLRNITQVDAQVARLMNHPRAKAKFQQFFSDWLKLADVKNPNNAYANYEMLLDYKDATFTGYTSNRMDQLYRTETQDFLANVIWNRRGSFKELMTLRKAYPREIRTAKVYRAALNPPSLYDIYNADLTLNGVVQEYDAPNHPGLLTRAAMLSSVSPVPNAILRGVGIKRRILCDTIPSPDFSIVANRVAELNALDETHANFPNYEAVTKLTSSTACLACHSAINPVGFLFETYSPLGTKYPVQNVVVPSFELDTIYRAFNLPKPSPPPGVYGVLLVQYPLPPAQKVFIENGLPDTFANSDEFINAISDSKRARACMEVRLFRHLQRRMETVADSCSLAEAGTVLNQNLSVLQAFTRSIANEDIFWRKSK